MSHHEQEDLQGFHRAGLPQPHVLMWDVRRQRYVCLLSSSADHRCPSFLATRFLLQEALTCSLPPCKPNLEPGGGRICVGEFAFSTGFPAKSGVAGALLIVIPNVMGICTWSPKLGPNGNSVGELSVACVAVRNKWNASSPSFCTDYT